jgi:Tol biopolymer transport system component
MPPACGVTPCGYGSPVPSPDGRLVLFSDWTSCEPSGHPESLYLAHADGSHRRRLISAPPHACSSDLTGSWSSDSRRLAYSLGDVIHVTDANGRQRAKLSGGGYGAVWQPHGRALAYTNYGLWVKPDGRKPVSVSGGDKIDDFVWSPTGKLLAYTLMATPSDLVLVRPDGTHRRTLLHAYLLDPSFSPDGRFVSVWTTDGTVTIDLQSGRQVRLELNKTLTWQPRGHRLTMAADDGIYLVDAATGDKRRLSPDRAVEASWSPDGTQLAYLATGGTWPFTRHDLKLVTLGGSVRTLVRATGNFGGSISDFVWTRPPASARFQQAQPRTLANVSESGLEAPWAVTRIATDGDRMAYVSCNHIFVWTPQRRQVVQADPWAGMNANCSTPDNSYYVAFWIYSLALSGDRIAWGELQGNMGQEWSIGAGSLSQPDDFRLFGSVGSASGCAVGNGGLGDLVGSGSLLVFSRWRDEPRCPRARTLEQHLYRADTGGCPCLELANAPGPLAPFDVDAGRIVAGGENATVILDGTGHQLLAVPVSPLAAQLTGTQLVVLVQGGLQVYDASTGVLQQSWRLPDVPSGGECGAPHSGAWDCHWDARLFLEDAANGLVAYVLDKQVHLLRFTDGADRVVTAGTLARFTSEGLVVVIGRRMELTPFEALPLRPW